MQEYATKREIEFTFGVPHFLEGQEAVEQLVAEVNLITYGGGADSAPPSGFLEFLLILINKYTQIVVDFS